MDSIIATTTVNGYTVIGTVDAKHVWRVASRDAVTKVAYQSGTAPFSGRAMWTEVKKGQDVTGLDLFEIV